MRKIKPLRAIIITVMFALTASGCVSLFSTNNVTIRTENNLSSIRAGGSLRLSATGQDIMWSVSSTLDGSGVVASGTGISSNGVLTAALGETSPILYVIAESTSSGQLAYKQIRVTSISDVTVTPSNQSVARGGRSQFRASVTGYNNPDSTVTWTVSSNAEGTGAVTQGTYISTSGQLTVSSNETLTVLYITAFSVVDPSKYGSTYTYVVVPVINSITVSPSGQTVATGSILQFHASVTGSNIYDNTVTWKVSSNASGTGSPTRGTSINSNGVLTVSSNETLTTLYVFAISTLDSSRYSSVPVYVSRRSSGQGAIASTPTPVATPTPSPTPSPSPTPTPVPTPTPTPVPATPAVTSVTISPQSSSLEAGNHLQFTAAVSGTNNPSTAVNWSVSSTGNRTGGVVSGTSISGSGLLTVSANETASVLYVTVTSAADQTKSASATVNVSKPPAQRPVTTTPTTTTPGHTNQTPQQSTPSNPQQTPGQSTPGNTNQPGQTPQATTPGNTNQTPQQSTPSNPQQTPGQSTPGNTNQPGQSTPGNTNQPQQTTTRR